MSYRKIIHIDMDAFYASVEQRDNPELRGKPVAVGGGSHRGVVAAASYEARVFGVRSALASVIAKRKCPELIFVKPRFEVYKAVSEQIHEVFSDFTPVIEPLSLDEAYLDLTDYIAEGVLAADVAMEIRARIFEATSLTASAGISYNKFLAKMASGQRKPNGQTVIAPERGEAFIEKLAIGKFHGVGPATASKMEKLDIFTGLDLKQKTLPFLQAHFGKFGSYLFDLARAIDDRPVRADRVRKSVGAERTFLEDIYTLEDAKAALPAIIEKVVGVCEKRTLAGRTVTLKVKYTDFNSITRRSTAGNAMRDIDSITTQAHRLLDTVFPLRKGIRLLGVSLSGLEQTDVKHEPQMQLI